jgi:raffinose synthase
MIHIAAVAYNRVFIGKFMLPDYHSSARAINGGPVYVSDTPGKHDFGC